jgi:hypothetical protein
MMSDLPAAWMAFKTATCNAKLKHFNECINEITHTNLQPWDLMDWVDPRKIPPVETILYQGVPCTSLVTYLSPPGDTQLFVYWCQQLSSILFRGSSSLQR